MSCLRRMEFASVAQASKAMDSESTSVLSQSRRRVVICEGGWWLAGWALGGRERCEVRGVEKVAVYLGHCDGCYCS